MATESTEAHGKINAWGLNQTGEGHALLCIHIDINGNMDT